jgi:hypothetical protein
LLGCAVISLAACPKLISQFKKGAEEGGAIVIDQFYQTRFLDETA